MVVTAHGEGWEVAANRAVDDMLTKVVSQHGDSKQLQENGTFELRYTPKDTSNQSFTIPLSDFGNQGQNKSFEAYSEDNDTIISRH